MRTPKEVLHDHLEKARLGKVEEDLEINYSEDTIVLSTYGTYHGIEGLRFLAEKLSEEIPDADFTYTNILVEGEIGFLEWKAESSNAKIEDGADSYWIRNGKIVAQTIHYTVLKK